MSRNKSKKRKKPKEKIISNPLTRHVEVTFSDRDDLTLIDGILPQVELALNSVGVRKFTDFKDYTSESLAKLLQQKAGINILSESIENQKWIESALVLADTNQIETNRKNEAEEVHTEKSKSQNEKPGTNNSDKKKVIHHIQENEKEKVSLKTKSSKSTLQNGDGSLLNSDESNKKELIENNSEQCKQIANQSEDDAIDNLFVAESAPEIRQEPVNNSSKSVKKSDLDQAFELEEQKSILMKGADEKVSLKIIDAKYFSEELPTTANTATKKVMHGEIRCNLTGEQAILASQYRFPLHAQIMVVDAETEKSEIMASISFQLTPQHDNYRIHLEFEVPKAGYYRLQAVAFLLATEPKIDFKEGPFLRVVPEQNYIR